MQETFLYTVNPRVPIRNIVKGEVIRKATNLMLTAEEVEICCKSAAVYRRFNPSKIIRVTIPDIPRLHRKEFVSEEEWKRSHSAEVIGRGETTPICLEVDEPEKNGEEEQSHLDDPNPVESEREDEPETVDSEHRTDVFSRMQVPNFIPMQGRVVVRSEEKAEDNTETGDTSVNDETEEDAEREQEEDSMEEVEETESTDDILKGLDVFSKDKQDDEPEKNGEEEQSHSDSHYNQGSRKKRRKR